MKTKTRDDGQGELAYNPHEYKAVSLRELPTPEKMLNCTNADDVVNYWKQHITTEQRYSPDVEQFHVLHLNTRRRVLGHHLVSTGTLNSCVVEAREVFRAAILTNASAIVLIHNHPSGDSTPSESDIAVTRNLKRAGQLLKIEVVDHVVMGNGQRSSLTELGYLS